MNIEHLSYWSGQLNREMYLNRYGWWIPVVVFVHQVEAIMSTMTLG